MYKLYARKAEFSYMLQRPRVIATKILGDLSLATKITQQKNSNNKLGGQKDYILFPRGCIGHPVATDLH